MNINNFLFCVTFSVCGVSAFSQQSSFLQDREKYKDFLAKKHYKGRNYRVAEYEYARKYFYGNDYDYLDLINNEIAFFYQSISGIMFGRKYSENSVEFFMKRYPNSSYLENEKEVKAEYFLSKKDFSRALENLEEINQYTLSDEENTNYILKLGYAKFMTDEIDDALRALEEAFGNVDGEYKSDIAYMLGHLYYMKGRVRDAAKYFRIIENNPKYSKIIKPYYLQIYFGQKKYDSAINEGKKALKEGFSQKYNAEINKIIGKSYFMQKNYSSAYTYLKAYLNSSGKPSEEDLYEMGFTSAQLKKYGEAISYYNRILNSQSELTQNAYYQLGNAYLQEGKKYEALSAFRSASQMDYDPVAQRFAYMQYAKLSYDIGNPFEPSSRVIQNYVNKYANAEDAREIRELLVKSYLYSGNYKETLSAVEKIKNKSPYLDKIEEEVSFLYGSQEFNKGNFLEAENLFRTSIDRGNSKEFQSSAKYWMGLSQYQQGSYDSARKTLQDLYDSNVFFEEIHQLPYDLAYVYFKIKNFKQAGKYFKIYLQNPKEEFKNDAELRLADTYYADNKLDEAIAIYDQNVGVADHIQYQRAMSLGLKGDNVAKISALQKLAVDYADSKYKYDALYELGVTHASEGKYAEANEYFHRVIQESDDENLVASAHIYRVQNLAELGQVSRAIFEFQNLGSIYKGTAYASKVLEASKAVYYQSGDVEGYQNFASKIGIDLSRKEVDEINLSMAQRYYANKQYGEAIPFYEKYLTQQPYGEKLYQAQYELGESYYQTKNTVKAMLLLSEVATTQNDYKQDSQVRLSQIYLSQKNVEGAKAHLKNLVSSANVDIKNYAIVEMMKLSVNAENFGDAEKYANMILANPKNSSSLKEHAQMVKARSLMKLGKDKDAKKAFSLLENSVNSSVAAEAIYTKAYYQNKSKSFRASNETIFNLANNYASEEYWGAKSLVLMAKNYLELGDKYQASYTIDQVIGNYGDFKDIIDEANKLKSRISK